jgi:ABC-type amino acid transport substrate-binding protein
MPFPILTFSLFILLTLKVHAIEVYKVALLESYPWAYKTESNVITGIYPEIFAELEQRYNASIKFDIQLMPLARIIHEVKKSQIDLAIMSEHAKRKINMVPHIAIYETPFVLFTKLNSSIEKLVDIKNKNVAMLIGGSGCPCLNEDIPYHKIKVSKHSQGLKMLMLNRVDAISGPYLRLNEQAKKLGVRAQLAKPITYQWRTVFLWSSHSLTQDKNKLSLFSDELNKSLKGGLLKRLLSKYFSTEELTYIVSPNKPSIK